MKRMLCESMIVFLVLASGGLQGVCGKELPQAGGGANQGATAVLGTPGDDVIATVGDQKITFSELNTMLNSSAVVGVSLPALGTPERDTVRITLLDKVVSANLLYLDALKQGLDKDPEYQADLGRFTNGILVALYRNRYLANNAEVSDAEVEAYLQKSGAKATEVTDDMRMAIRSVLRKQRISEQSGEMRATLRRGVTVQLNEAELDPLKDAGRADEAVLATVDGKPLTWGAVKQELDTRVSSTSTEQRREAVNGLVDERIMIEKAKANGLEQDPVYQARVGEYRKTDLINLHRARLAKQMEPGNAELHAYFEANRARISIPEYRKVQMVVLKTKDEANDVKQQIVTKKITMFQAAADYSIAPDAKNNLGEIGWVEKGKALAQLNDVVFALGPGEVGGPVQVGDVWHLVMVEDVRAPLYTDFNDDKTRAITRRQYIHDKLDAYVVNLREHEFAVKVDEAKLIRLAQQEADTVKQLAEKAQQPGSETLKRIQQYRKLMKP
jgi:peptidyl-prolyl cis-trans isomerase C